MIRTLKITCIFKRMRLCNFEYFLIQIGSLQSFLIHELLPYSSLGSATRDFHIAVPLADISKQS